MFRHIHKYFKDNLQSLQKKSDGVCTEELVGGGGGGVRESVTV